MTQCEAVLNHMKNKGSITSIEAFEEYGITRLSGRIFNLRKLGHNIELRSCSTKNRYGNTVSYAKYILKE